MMRTIFRGYFLVFLPRFFFRLGGVAHLRWALPVLVFGCATPDRPHQPATLLLVNGNFFTADSSRPQASALAIRDDRIVYVGDDAGARALAGSTTEIMDLQGGFAMPGFIEGHGHFLGLGRSLVNVNLMTTRHYGEVVSRVAERARTLPPGAWIEGRGWHQEKWTPRPERTVNGYPYHDSLSAATPDHPVVLYHASGHALLANARAMELAGLSGESGDPLGGRIVRDGSGRMTGVFEENAMDLIERPLTAWKNRRSEDERRADFDQAVELAGRECRAKGITSFQDAGSSFWEIEQYERLAHAGRLPLRLWVMIGQPKAHEFARLDSFPKIGLGRGFLTVRAMKAYLDGALGSYGAWLLAPYADKPDSYGHNTTPLDTLRTLAAQCRAHGLQFCVHAIGDRGNREVLDVMQATGVEGLRWRIEHAQHVDPADQPRFARLGVIASMQAIHCTSDAPFVVRRLGEERARSGAYAWRSLLDRGAHLANGTDAPVEDVDPLASIHAAATRKRADNGLEFFPEQAMTRQEALLSYTLWNAYAGFEEGEKGSLTPGKLADIVLLDTDLLRCQPEEILKARVLKTIVGGKVR